MKKLLSMMVIGIMFLGSANTSFAANHVSQMATEKGGRHVAECAQTMDLGVSECVQLPECQDEM